MDKLSHGYKTSKNYEKLFELMKTNRIVCFVDVKDYKDENGYILQDVYQTQVMVDDSRADISARGISYISAFAFRDLSVKEDFIKQCNANNLEFIEPNT